MDTPTLTAVQKRVLRELVHSAEQSGTGVREGTLEWDVLADLEPVGLVRRTTWGGLFPPHYFPTDAGREAARSQST